MNRDRACQLSAACGFSKSTNQFACYFADLTDLRQDKLRCLMFTPVTDCRRIVEVNPGKHFVAILETPLPFDPEADLSALLDGNAITVTPLILQQTDRAAIDALQRRFSSKKRGAA